MPQNPQTLEELRQAMVLAEQTKKVTQPKPSSVGSVDIGLAEEIQCLWNQLSEELAITSHYQAQKQPNSYPYQNFQWSDYQRRTNYQPGPPREQRSVAEHQQQEAWKCPYCGGKRNHVRSGRKDLARRLLRAFDTEKDLARSGFLRKTTLFG